MSLAYFEWSADPDASLDDPDAWAAANPALGHRLSGDFIEIERSAMTDEEFAIERLGVWSEDDGEPPVISDQQWSRCATKESDADRLNADARWLGQPMTLAVDMTRDRDWGSIGAVGECREGGLALVVEDHRQDPSGWLLDRVIELCEARSVACVVIDVKSAAATLIGPLKDAGIVVVEATYEKVVRATGEFFDDVLEARVVHQGQSELDAAVAGATQRTAGDAWLWDRRKGAVITPLIAVTLARYGHLHEKPQQMAAPGVVFL